MQFIINPQYGNLPLAVLLVVHQEEFEQRNSTIFWKAVKVLVGTIRKRQIWLTFKAKKGTPLYKASCKSHHPLPTWEKLWSALVDSRLLVLMVTPPSFRIFMFGKLIPYRSSYPSFGHAPQRWRGRIVLVEISLEIPSPIRFRFLLLVCIVKINFKDWWSHFRKMTFQTDVMQLCVRNSERHWIRYTRIIKSLQKHHLTTCYDKTISHILSQSWTTFFIAWN